MKHLDLFSGIGGFALAARNVGWDTVAFCEIEPYCQKVLAKNFPGIPIYDDVRELNGQEIGPVDIITGGFPCQDISYAGKGAGIDGERSGLWTEVARLIGDIRPQCAVLENVAALLSRGLDRVAGDLAQIGYDCEWHCIPASAVGAPHRRDRIWIIAYPQDNGYQQWKRSRVDKRSIHQTIKRDENKSVRSELVRCSGEMADTEGESIGTGLREDEQTQLRRRRSGDSSGEMADTNFPRLERRIREVMSERARERTTRTGSDPWDGYWITEPPVGRVANGIPRRVDRLRGLGNAIVPQVAEVIFKAINDV